MPNFHSSDKSGLAVVVHDINPSNQGLLDLCKFEVYIKLQDRQNYIEKPCF